MRDFYFPVEQAFAPIYQMRKLRHRKVNLPKVTQLIRSRAGTPTQEGWPRS